MGVRDGCPPRGRSHQTAGWTGEWPESSSAEIYRQPDWHDVELCTARGGPGKWSVIDDPESLDVVPLKRKAASLHWEFMFAGSMWQTPDMAEQGRLLTRVSELVDRGELRSTQRQTFSPISVENLKQAHALVESCKAIGKVTLSGF